MPAKISIVDIDTAVGPFQVTGRIEVTGSSGLPEDDRLKARSLGERIERAVTTAIVNFRSDFSIDEEGGA